MRMSKKRKTNQDYIDLQVDFVDEDVAIPRHFLREWREYKKLSQDDLAGLIGTSKSVISGFETGRELSQSWLWRIATALRIQPGHILQTNPENMDTDIIELWASIPDEHKNTVRHQLEALSREDTKPNGTHG